MKALKIRLERPLAQETLILTMSLASSSEPRPEEEETTESKDMPTDLEAGIDDEQILFVEQKYCTVCNLEQPLRTKHC